MRSRRTPRVFPKHEGRLPVVTKCHREVREGSQGSWWNWGVILEEPSGEFQDQAQETSRKKLQESPEASDKIQSKEYWGPAGMAALRTLTGYPRAPQLQDRPTPLWEEILLLGLEQGQYQSSQREPAASWRDFLMPCHRSHHLMPWLCESSSSTHPENNHHSPLKSSTCSGQPVSLFLISPEPHREGSPEMTVPSHLGDRWSRAQFTGPTAGISWEAPLPGQEEA
eukprot:bmy_13653T0